MNITRKKIWNESLIFLTPFKVLFTIAVILCAEPILAQKPVMSPIDVKADSVEKVAEPKAEKDSVIAPQFPDPKMVMRRSLIIPGWGQVTNKQAWKVPFVYGLIGGLSYYSFHLTGQYHDYRAAYYNLASGNTDFKFGPTPAYLANTNVSSLQDQRDFLRNRRDFIYITIGLAYLLNVVDAYVFAHLRPFDVSDDLSLSPAIKSNTFYAGGIGEVPALTLSINFSR